MDSPLRIFARWSCKYTAAHERGRLRARPHAVKLPQLGKAPLTPRAFRLFPRPQNHAGRKRRAMTISEAKQDGHRRMGLLRAGKTSKPLSPQPENAA